MLCIIIHKPVFEINRYCTDFALSVLILLTSSAPLYYTVEDGSAINVSSMPLSVGRNPRIDPGEEYFPHLDIDLIHRLVNLLSKHYPERLSKALVVPGKGYSSYLGQQVLTNPLNLRNHIPDKKTRSKVKILSKNSALLHYIDKDELVTFVGGNSPVMQSDFAPN